MDKTRNRSLSILLFTLLASIVAAAGIAFASPQAASAADENAPSAAESASAVMEAVATTNGYVMRVGDYEMEDYVLGDTIVINEILRANNIDFDPERAPNVSNIRTLTGAFTTDSDRRTLGATKTGEDFVSFLYKPKDSEDLIETDYYEASCTLPPTGVVLNKNKMKLTMDETSQLTATVQPEDATDKEVNWTSDDNTIATVSESGVVTPVSVGKTTVRAWTSNEKEAACEVEVVKKTQTITAKDVTGTVGESGKKIKATTDGDGTLSYKVTKGANIVSVDAKGALTLKAAGKAKVTVTAAETDQYAAATKVVNVTVTAVPTSCTLTFDANGGSGTMSKMTADAGTTVSLAANKFTRSGYTFEGWNTAKDGKGKSYADKSQFKLDADTTLYAQWKEDVATYTLTFNANGGTGTMDKMTANAGTSITLPANTFKRTGYTFAGWNTAKDGKGKSYKDKSEIKLDADTTLYAQWTKGSGAATKKGGTTAKTGDTLPIGILIGVAVVAVAVLCCAGIVIARRRNR